MKIIFYEKSTGNTVPAVRDVVINSACNVSMTETYELYVDGDGYVVEVALDDYGFLSTQLRYDIGFYIDANYQQG